MAIEFSTSEFERSHGHLPRGMGNWAFAEDRNATDDKILWAHGTLTAAKKEIRAQLAAKNPPVKNITLYILP